MSDDETKKIIFALGEEKRGFLAKLQKWNSYVPKIQRDLEYQTWLENAVLHEPEILSQNTGETFKSVLAASYETLPGVLNIPEPPENLGVYISASGTAAPAQYYRYMESMESNFSENVIVVEWAEKNKTDYRDLQKAHDVSSEVRKRVATLNPMLEELHQSSVDAVLKCSAKQIDPPQAVVDPRRLLEQFKGHLIDKCKSGKGSTYKRIADNLAADSKMTQLAIENEQDTYDRLATEFTYILKRIETVEVDYLLELFRQLEEHIMVITSAIDPNKIGFNFIED